MDQIEPKKQPTEPGIIAKGLGALLVITVIFIYMLPVAVKCARVMWDWALR